MVSFLLFSLQIISTVCSSSDLVAGVSSLCVWRCGLLLVLLLSGREVQWSPLYRLLPRTGLPWLCPGCTGPPWIPWDAIEKRCREARWSTCAGLQLSSLTSYRRAEKPKMVSTSSSSPIYGLRPRIRGWSVISTEPGLYLHLCIRCIRWGIRYRWYPCTTSMVRVEDPGTSFMLYLGPGPPSLLHLTRANET